ncbi:MAG: hypothetical protein WEA77_03645, partial [Hyphomonas sp.]|uniref:hypothetical protein n=1 Tax=Hyphomonas sp. TaxID=87 RepID=UPI00349FDE93
MADYYTPTVIEPFIPLSAILPIERLFLAAVFSEEVDGENAYYYSDDGACDLITLSADEVRAALDTATPDTCRLAQKLIDEQPDATLGDEDIDLDSCGDLWPDVLQDIVRRSPDLDHLTV